MNEYKPFFIRKKTELTKKEKELLELERRGFSHKEIAEQRGIKTESVHFMKTKINRKLKRAQKYERPAYLQN